MAANPFFEGINKDIREKSEARKSEYPNHYPSENLNAPDYNLCRNLIQNPSFEGGFHYWESLSWPRIGVFSTACAGVDSADARSGVNSLWIEAKSGASNSVRTLTIPVFTGKRYTLSFYVKGAPGAFLNYYVYPGNSKLNKELISGKARCDAEWRRHNLTFTAPDNSAAIMFSSATQNPRGNIRVDDVQLEEGPQATEFTQKAITAALWTDHFDNLFDLGEAINPKLEIYTPRPSISGDVTMTVRSSLVEEPEWRQALSFTTDATGKAVLPLRFPERIQSPGLYIVRCDFQLADGYKDYDFFRYGIMRFLSGEHKRRVLFGSYFQPNMIPDCETAAKRYAQMGFGSLRLSGWYVGDPELCALLAKYGIRVYSGALASYPGDGRYGHSRKISEYKKNGVKILPDIKYGYMSPEMDMSKVEEYSRDLVSRNPHIDAWHLTLEPEFEAADRPENLNRFIAQQQAIIRGVRKANPHAKIIGLGPQ